MSSPNAYYEHVQSIMNLTPLKRNWVSLCSDLYYLPSPRPDAELRNEECQVYYEMYNQETLAWKTSLALMSWVLRNFQRKIDNGHCNNTKTHEHHEKEPRDCQLGRHFHEEMLAKILDSYKNVINTFDPQQASTNTQSAIKSNTETPVTNEG